MRGPPECWNPRGFVAQTHDQRRRRARAGIAQDRLARHQRRAQRAGAHARARAAGDRRTRLPARSVRAQPAQRAAVRDRPGLRQSQPVLRDRGAERRAVGVPRDRLRPADPSLRFVLARRSPREIIDLVQHSRLAGLVLAPPMSERKELVTELVAQGIRLVRIVSAAADPQDGSACVYVDDRDAAYEITEHLIQLGHSRIGFLWGGKSHGSSWERYKGYEDALRDYGITLDRGPRRRGRLFVRRRFPRRAPPARAGRSPDRDLRQQRRDRRRRAGGRQVQRHERALRPVDRRLRGQPVLQAELAGADHGQAGHQEIAQHAARRLLQEIREQPPRRPLPNEGFSPQLVVRGSTAPPRAQGQGLSETSSRRPDRGSSTRNPSLSRATNVRSCFPAPRAGRPRVAPGVRRLRPSRPRIGDADMQAQAIRTLARPTPDPALAPLLESMPANWSRIGRKIRVLKAIDWPAGTGRALPRQLAAAACRNCRETADAAEPMHEEIDGARRR